MVNRYRVWILVAAFVGVVAGVKMLLWWGAQPSLRPEDMPVDSVWVDAPTLPFSWHHGWWLGCWIDADGHSDRCKLWGAGPKNPVVFDGQYVSCETHFAVAADELKLKAPSDSMQMWVGVPSGERLAPAIFLQNGEHLVPIEATRGCEELMGKLKPKP